MREPRDSQVLFSPLIFSIDPSVLASASTCTTMVLIGTRFSEAKFGCGTRTSRPLGVSGVITIKMISNTSKISINGTTFISAIALPLLSPTDIPMGNSPSTARTLRKSAAPCGWRRGVTGLPTNEWAQVFSDLVRWIRRRRRRFVRRMVLLREQTQLIDARRADFIDRADDIAVFGASIGLHEYGF